VRKRNSSRKIVESYPERDRRTCDEPLPDTEPVVLTRKYAEAIDGVNLAGRAVGDRLPLTRHDAKMLIAEGWARPVPEEQRRHSSDQDEPRSHHSRRVE
jgi:hypothetical protein